MTDTDPTPWEQARRPGIELAKKIAVRTGDDELCDCLIVDCFAVMRSEHDVRFWVLEPEADGMWSHAPSGGEVASLSEQLQSIATCYTDRFNPDQDTP